MLRYPLQILYLNAYFLLYITILAVFFVDFLK